MATWGLTKLASLQGGKEAPPGPAILLLVILVSSRELSCASAPEENWQADFDVSLKLYNFYKF